MLRLLADPKGTVERELGQPLPDSLAIEVVQESVGKMYLVLPLAVVEAEHGTPFGHSSPGRELDDAALSKLPEAAQSHRSTTGRTVRSIDAFRPAEKAITGRDAASAL